MRCSEAERSVVSELTQVRPLDSVFVCGPLTHKWLSFAWRPSVAERDSQTIGILVEGRLIQQHRHWVVMRPLKFKVRKSRLVGVQDICDFKQNKISFMTFIVYVVSSVAKQDYAVEARHETVAQL